MYKREEIEKKLLESGSAHEQDTRIPVIENGLYIIQHLEEYVSYISFLSKEYTKFDNCIFIGIGSGGEIKFFCDLFECKNILTIDDGSFDFVYKHWHKIKNKCSQK